MCINVTNIFKRVSTDRVNNYRTTELLLLKVKGHFGFFIQTLSNYFNTLYNFILPGLHIFTGTMLEFPISYKLFNYFFPNAASGT